MTEEKSPFEDYGKRADIIDAVVRLVNVSHHGVYTPKPESTYDEQDIRSAVAMALALYVDDNVEMIEMMKKLTSRD